MSSQFIDLRPLCSMAVLAIGYDDTQKRLVVRSGFGPDWGQAGYFTLPYDYVEARDMATDFWTLGG